MMTPENITDIEQAFESSKPPTGMISTLIKEVIMQLTSGELRVCNPPKVEGEEWVINEWVKKAILLYFRAQKMQKMHAGDFTFVDKIPVRNWATADGVRVVPQAIVREGAYISPGAILMPSYTNIGAYVDQDTMVDTWATVGSCAQVGKGVHLSGGVGLGGVLEPLQAQPVIIEDHAFLGSRCVVVEGVHIGKQAVLGAGVVLTASTPIIDVNRKDTVLKGHVPPRSVVIPGSRQKEFPHGTYSVPCALIIGQRTDSTDHKTALTEALRQFPS